MKFGRFFKNEYRGTLKIRTIKLQYLKGDFVNMKMKEIELLKNYSSPFTHSINFKFVKKNNREG